MNHAELLQNIRTKNSFLCIGLDSDIARIPSFLLNLEDPVFEFNKAIIESTHPFAVSYKLNTAFYEANGLKGWQSLKSTLDFIKTFYPDILVIADAKRGDIGNTSKMYARAFFENMAFDAVTVAPYMGEDSVIPFLTYEDKWVILLALTSNRGADDFQYHSEMGAKLFEKVLSVSQQWGTINNMMYVVGATRAEMLRRSVGFSGCPCVRIGRSRVVLYSSCPWHFGRLEPFCSRFPAPGHREQPSRTGAR